MALLIRLRLEAADDIAHINRVGDRLQHASHRAARTERVVDFVVRVRWSGPLLWVEGRVLRVGNRLVWRIVEKDGVARAVVATKRRLDPRVRPQL